MAVREAASSSSGCLMLIGSSSGLMGSSGGLNGSSGGLIGSSGGLTGSSRGLIGSSRGLTPMGINIALIGGLSPLVEGRACMPAQMVIQATSSASHHQPTPDRIMFERWVAILVTVWWQPDSLLADGLSAC